MNNEIKEKNTKRIVEKIEGLATYANIPKELAIYNVNIDSQEAKLLTDYITNLQECYCNRTDCSSRIKDSRKYDSLQQRIDKAVELCDNLLNNDIVIIEGKEYYKQEADDIITQFIKNTLIGSDEE